MGGAGAGTGTGTPAGASGSGSALSSLLAALGKLPGGAQLALGAGALGALGGLLGNSNHSGSGSTAGPNPPPLWGSETTGSSGPGYNYANYGGAGYFPRQAVSPIAQSDYYTYGQRPEQLFFENAPAAIAPTTTGMKRGGALRSVSYIRGAGSGRSDTVPIKGSPGEYMMDAETVSLLGDGNNEAGARKLDQMRKQIRRHKGKALARGKFSPNAKLPVQYMGAR